MMEPASRDAPNESINSIDPKVLSALPDVEKLMDVRYHGESAWAKTFCITVRHTDGNEERYFMKVSVGDHGRDALKGEFASTSAIFGITPDFCPKPIAWGTFETDANSHFYICKFYDFTEGLPSPESFCKNVARLHSSPSPNGKFGFDCVTYNGDMPQDNTWNDSWEEFFANGLRHVLKVREERAGPSPELEALLPSLFEKVIPSLLRPLETNGRKVKPSLVHGDLWCGNTSIYYESTQAFGHTTNVSTLCLSAQRFKSKLTEFLLYEDELGNWRPARNRFTRRYFQAYHSHIPRSEPVEDYEDRNALYALRFNLHTTALFPDKPDFLEGAIQGIKELTEKFPNGPKA